LYVRYARREQGKNTFTDCERLWRRETSQNSAGYKSMDNVNMVNRRKQVSSLALTLILGY